MLKVEQETIDLGTLKYQETYRFEIKIFNTSLNETEITSIIKGCGKCTHINIDSMTVPANGVRILRVEFTPDHTTTKDNKVTKSITINYRNEFNKPDSLRVYFQAKVVLP